MTGAAPAAKKKTAPTTASETLPAGSYSNRWVEVKLPAESWFATWRTNGVADTALPGMIGVEIDYTGATGEIEIVETALTASPDAAPNLLANGGFESVGADGQPESWSPQQKYRYFPPRYYYIFNTWHNSVFDNRGPVAIDELSPHTGRRSLQMIVAAGDEKCVTSAPVALNQTEPRLIEAAMRQFQKLPTYHIFAQKSHDPAVELAERLLAIAPVPMSKAFFASSGSEANDTAIKIIWYYHNAIGKPQKKKIIGRAKGHAIADTWAGSRLVYAPPQTLKALALDTPVPTPAGWTARSPAMPMRGRTGRGRPIASPSRIRSTWRRRPIAAASAPRCSRS